MIGNVRKKYAILNGTISINFLTMRNGEETPLIDRIAVPYVMSVILWYHLINSNKYTGIKLCNAVYTI